jgi:DNA-directed RNA polymerase subunit RPC12/RpoP
MPECPYCGEKVHDIGADMLECADRYEHDCPHCGKKVLVQEEPVIEYHLFRAPCLNGGDHTWHNVHGAQGVKRQSCFVCGAMFKSGLDDLRGMAADIHVIDRL